MLNQRWKVQALAFALGIMAAVAAAFGLYWVVHMPKDHRASAEAAVTIPCPGGGQSMAAGYARVVSRVSAADAEKRAKRKATGRARKAARANCP